jgi:hypothetical protein
MIYVRINFVRYFFVVNKINIMSGIIRLIPVF